LCLNISAKKIKIKIMPIKRIVANNKKLFKFEAKPNKPDLDSSSKNFDSLKSELFLISDRHKMFNLTWHGIVAVVVFSCSIVVLVLLKA